MRLLHRGPDGTDGKFRDQSRDFTKGASQYSIDNARDLKFYNSKEVNSGNVNVAMRNSKRIADLMPDRDTERKYPAYAFSRRSSHGALTKPVKTASDSTKRSVA